MLCGSSFNLLVQRHRLFECSFFVLTMDCIHGRHKKDKPPLHRLQGRSRVVGCYGNGRGKGDTVGLWSRAMAIDWMTRAELSQAIPPAYTEWIGRQLIQYLGSR
jgi:DNA (cytosine-5)-methyltransferase 1